MAEILRVTQGIIPKLADTLASFGGRLECQNCNTTKPLGNIRRRLSRGWPECCGYTMRWVTARQLAERAALKEGEPLRAEDILAGLPTPQEGKPK